MVKIYYRHYKAMIDEGGLTLEEVIALVNEEVPERWRQAVIDKLQEDNDLKI